MQNPGKQMRTSLENNCFIIHVGKMSHKQAVTLAAAAAVVVVVVFVCFWHNKQGLGIYINSYIDTFGRYVLTLFFI